MSESELRAQNYWDNLISTFIGRSQRMVCYGFEEIWNHRWLIAEDALGNRWLIARTYDRDFSVLTDFETLTSAAAIYREENRDFSGAVKFACLNIGGRMDDRRVMLMLVRNTEVDF